MFHFFNFLGRSQIGTLLWKTKIFREMKTLSIIEFEIGDWGRNSSKHIFCSKHVHKTRNKGDLVSKIVNCIQFVFYRHHTTLKFKTYEIRFTIESTQFQSDFRILNERAGRFDFILTFDHFCKATYLCLMRKTAVKRTDSSFLIASASF